MAEDGEVSAYWKGTVDARLHVIELALTSNLKASEESRVSLETTLRRVHEDICIELRNVGTRMNKGDASFNKFIGGIAVTLFVLNLLAGVVIRYTFK